MGNFAGLHKVHKSILSNTKKLLIDSTSQNRVVKHCSPNLKLVHKDGALFYDKSHLKFEAPSYTTHHPLSSNQVGSS